MDDPDAISDKIITYYNENAANRFDYFEQGSATHCDYCLRFMTPAPGKILDIGSGSGRDAAIFAAKGYEVVAVEPADELRALAEQKHSRSSIRWSGDRLPDLKQFAEIADIFDHIHLSAVIFHLPLSETRKVLQNCHRLLKRGGTLFVGLRIGPSDPARPMFNVDKEWVLSQSKDLFDLIDWMHSEDDHKRADVEWHRLMLKKI